MPGTDQERLKRPPIVEAVIEFISMLPAEVTPQQLGALDARIGQDFPQRDELNVADINLQASAIGLAVSTTSKPAGFRFTSRDGKYILQARTNGFAFSRLAPYESFDKFSSKAKELWEHYKSVASPTRVTRIGLRYINRLEIPLPLSDFSEYVLTRPELPSNVTVGVSDFFMRLVIPQDTESGVILTETIAPRSAGQEKLSLILDIDAYFRLQSQPDTSLLWSKLDRLRFLKNEMFFKTITQKARELFE